jgi:hypothetical protein
MPDSLPSAALVSCHLERPLDDATWSRFVAFARRRPGGFPILALMRPPHEGEDRALWLERAREALSVSAFGHHTHWTSPTHARPTGGDPAARVREEAAWLRGEGLTPRYFCGGGWYTDDAVREAVAESGYTDCTERTGGPRELRLPSGRTLTELPTTHSIGRLARAVVTPKLPSYVHAYFHDYDLLDRRRHLALVAALALLSRRARPLDLSEVSAR